MAAERCWVWLMVSHTGGVGVMICCDFVCTSTWDDRARHQYF